MNKKGQSLSTGAIILIILGVIVLVILAFGFTVGWNKLLPFISSGDNVNTVVTQCSTYCSLGATSKYDFCTKLMTINANGTAYTGTCNQFASDPASVTIGGTKATTTQQTDIGKFAVQPCAAITC